MKIYALKGPSTSDYDPEELQITQNFLTESIGNGISRFGWGYIDSVNLNELQNKPWNEMTKEEQNCWAKSSFLLGIEKDDWVVYINLPSWGACIAGKVSKPYHFEKGGNNLSDYRHLLELEEKSIVEFERNDDRVLPIISSRLKLQGRYWTIQYIDEFIQTIQNLKSKSLEKKHDESVERFYLKKDLLPLFKNITEIIQKTHPASKLESLIAEVFRKVPNVVDVKEHGKHKGWGTDSGADIIVTYKSGLCVSNLEKDELLVVQVKSYVGQHWETSAVEQIETAIKEFQADAGLIITTAETTEKLEKAIDDLSNKLSKPEK